MAVTAPLPAAGVGAESHNDSNWIDAADGRRRRPPPRRPAERVRKLLLLGLLGAAAVALWLRLLASQPHLPLVLRMDGPGRIVLVASSDATLHAAVGRPVLALLLADGQRVDAVPALLPQSPRWIVDDAERRQHQRLQAVLGQALAQHQRLTVQFDAGLQLALLPQARGLSGLGGLSWAVSALALALYLSAAVAVLARSGLSAWLFLCLALAQSLNLLMIGAGALPGLGQSATLAQLDFGGRLAADVLSAAALLHVLALYPRRLGAAHVLGALAWAGAAVALAWLLIAQPAGLWWWAQALVLAAGVLAVLVLRQPNDQAAHAANAAHAAASGQPGHALARLMQRLVLAGTGTLALLTLALATAGVDGDVPYHLATLGSAAWSVFFASLLMLGPFLSRSRQVLREFTLLAGVSTVAASLTLLFLAIFGLDPLAALGLALLAAVGVYLIARPWMLGQLAGPGAPSAERLFDSLYRAARALEQTPAQAMRHLADLLREVFEPIEVVRTSRSVSRVRVAADGASLVVPVLRPPQGAMTAGDSGGATGAIVLRHAQRGQRLFTQADQQLCERLLEQLRRAVAFDRAVEQGRAEERARIAQDLHDDIGARLLTLMYKAPNEEIEEYIRHTLQDLKTLTRGLAASNQRLSHAAAEWKADISQRLTAAGCRLQWSFSTDRDLTLSAVQWSGLTRVLRELVNNIISHAEAHQVEITLQLDHGELLMTVSDDGIGNAPEAWSHGLGLGGVRKRVKLLGGQVRWCTREVRGIRCEVRAGLGRPLA